VDYFWYIILIWLCYMILIWLKLLYDFDHYTWILVPSIQKCSTPDRSLWKPSLLWSAKYVMLCAKNMLMR